MKSIVTGGAGFIGSHLVDRLLSESHSAVVIDNFSNGHEQNLEQHKYNKDLKIVKADVADFKKIEKYFKDINWVFHLAALADIVPSINEPLKYYHSNVTGTASVLEASRQNNVERFVYAASSSCYGIPDLCPTPETAEIRPQYPYALTKFLGEQIMQHWNNIYKLPSVSLRLFNVYGLRSRTSGTYGAVFGVFLAQKLAGKPFTIVGDGNQTRDFTFVSDVVNAFVLAAKSNVKNEIINIGSGKPQTVNKLVELLDSSEGIVHIPKRPGEPDSTHADITKAKKLLKWDPKVPFEEGIKIMLENIDYWKDAPLWTPNKIKNATKLWFKYLK